MFGFRSFHGNQPSEKAAHLPGVDPLPVPVDGQPVTLLLQPGGFGHLTGSS
jgi:hypothetical protein